MIKYRLRCARGHEFEAWFQNSAAFDKLAKRKHLTCATCGTDKVEKAIMSPRIAKSGERSGGVKTGAAGARDGEAGVVAMPEQGALLGQPGMPGDEPQNGQALRAAMKALRQTVISTADYVGPRFAEEARRMHDEEAPARGIYGEASIEEARELLEDGISIVPLPPAPDEGH